jgi:hypothetical protein
MAAAGKAEKERRVKIAYLYHFLKTVTWPHGTSPRKTQNADVCIIGDRQLSKDLRAIAKRNPETHIKMKILYSTTGATIPDCHILFIGRTATAQLTSILELAGNRPILTVSDIKGFANKGGMIEIVTIKQDDRTYLRPRINSAVAEISSITLGPELLCMADHAQQEGLLIISDHSH